VTDPPLHPDTHAPGDAPGDELYELLAALADDALTDEQAERLTALLRDDPAARQAYYDHLALDAHLHWELRGKGEQPIALSPPEAKAAHAAHTAHAASDSVRLDRRRADGDRGHAGYYRYAAAAALLIVAGVTTALLWTDAGPNTETTVAQQPVEDRPVALIADAHDARWSANTGHDLLDIGADVTPGRLQLDAGSIELVTRSTVAITLLGPADLELVDANRCRLHRGRIVATVPGAAHGFTVETPTHEVVDLGTRFGVSVDDDRRTEVHVFEGRVRFAGAGDERIVEAGQAVRGSIDLRAEPTAAQPERAFVDGARLNRRALSTTAASTAAVRRDSPAAYWRFPQSDGPDEAATAPGVVERRAVRLIGDAAIEDGALTFGERGDGLLTVTDSLPELLSGDYTIELWLRPARPTGSVLALSIGEKHAAMIALSRDRPGLVRFLHRLPPGITGGREVFSPRPLRLDRWHHVVAVRRGRDLMLYVDGEPVASASGVEGSLRQPVTVHMGQRLPESGRDRRPFIGRIDEVALYRRALTDEEVARHYRSVLDGR